MNKTHFNGYKWFKGDKDSSKEGFKRKSDKSLEMASNGENMGHPAAKAICLISSRRQKMLLFTAVLEG